MRQLLLSATLFAFAALGHAQTLDSTFFLGVNTIDTVSLYRFDATVAATVQTGAPGTGSTFSIPNLGGNFFEDRILNHQLPGNFNLSGSFPDATYGRAESFELQLVFVFNVPNDHFYRLDANNLIEYGFYQANTSLQPQTGLDINVSETAAVFSAPDTIFRFPMNLNDSYQTTTYFYDVNATGASIPPCPPCLTIPDSLVKIQRLIEREVEFDATGTFTFQFGGTSYTDAFRIKTTKITTDSVFARSNTSEPWVLYTGVAGFEDVYPLYDTLTTYSYFSTSAGWLADYDEGVTHEDVEVRRRFEVRTNKRNEVSSRAGEFARLDAALYPNPVSTHASLRLPAGVQAAEVVLTDLTGRVVLQTEAQHAQLLDLTDLPTGLYTFTVTSGNARATGKLVRQ